MAKLSLSCLLLLLALCPVAAFETPPDKSNLSNLIQIGVPYSKLVDTAKVKEVIPVNPRQRAMICVL